jgi:hypothetical protein
MQLTVLRGLETALLKDLEATSVIFSYLSYVSTAP